MNRLNGACKIKSCQKSVKRLTKQSSVKSKMLNPSFGVLCVPFFFFFCGVWNNKTKQNKTEQNKTKE